MTLSDIEKKVAEYVKSHDIFWLSDLKKELGITDNYQKESAYVSKVCIKMQRGGILMCCDKKAGHTQYMRVIY